MGRRPTSPQPRRPGRPGRSCPTCRSKRPGRWPKSAAGGFQPDPADYAHHPARPGPAHRRQTTGFIYYVSVTGITGERTALPPEIAENVGWLREQTPLPICIGFGISRPEHVRKLAPVADGLIVGSAIVRRIAAAGTKPRQAVLEDVGQFVGTLLAALSPEQPPAPAKI